MSQVSNLDILTDKVYREGIEKAENDAKEIRAEAKAESERMIAEAQREAEKTVTAAKREAERITRTMENELQLKGQQLISDLKTRIHKTLSKKILDQPTRDAFQDEDFIQSAVLEAISAWNAKKALEIQLPKDLERRLQKSFDSEIRKRSKNLIIEFNQELSSGFRISEQGEGYQISFSEEDFKALFTPYLQEQTRRILFNESA